MQRRRQICAVLLTAFLLTTLVAAMLPSATARADLMAVGTGLSLSWDRTLQPTTSSFLTIPITDTNTPTDSRTISGWSLGIRIVPEGGATGTISFDVATIQY